MSNFNFQSVFKPPTSVFLLAITTLAAILFTYALVLQLFDHKIMNPDIQRWKNLYKSISKLGACLDTKLLADMQKKDKKQLTEHRTRIDMAAEAELVIDSIQQKSYYVRAFVHSEDLGFNTESTLEVIVSVLSNKNHGRRKSVCVSVFAPSNLLPSPPLPSCKQPKFSAKENITLLPESEKNSCKSGHYGSLSLDINPEFVLYLSDKDTTLVAHNIGLSVIVILSIAFSYVAYSVLKKLLCCKSSSNNAIKSHPSDANMLRHL